MNKLQKLLFKIGLHNHNDDASPFSYNHNDYKVDDNKEKIKTHRDFLKSLADDETERLTVIENKTSQLISQTGIIFSLLSLIVPVLIDKATDMHFAVKLLLLALLIFSFLFYMLTIRNALKNFNIHKFKYSRPSPENVITFQKKGIDDFLSEEVRDLLYCINENLKINNRKGTNLLHSYNSFKIANTITGILVVTFSVFILFFNPKKEGLKIVEPIQIQNLDSSLNKIIEAISQKKDTVVINLIKP